MEEETILKMLDSDKLTWYEKGALLHHLFSNGQITIFDYLKFKEIYDKKKSEWMSNMWKKFK